jgi:glycosyltransferase involved in cell wall biosynthesis
MDSLVIPLVSIIIPCYNQGRYLSESLESVFLQSYKNWECIIINDGSTDETEDVAHSYVSKDARFKYIKTQNSGLSASRNTGIKNADGNFIQLLDADDLIEQDKLKSAITLYLSGTINAHAIVYSSMRYFEDKQPSELKILGRDNFIAHIELKQDDELKSQKDLLRSRNPFVISAPLYPLSLFDEVGYFDEIMSALEDWDFHLRCEDAGYRFHHQYEPRSRTLIRLHNNSMMRDQKLLDENFYKLNLKHVLITAEPVKRASFIKRLFRAATPPIIVKLLKIDLS